MYRNFEGTLYWEWTSKGGFVELPWNSSSGLLLYRNSEGTCMGNGPQKEAEFVEPPGIPLFKWFTL